MPRDRPSATRTPTSAREKRPKRFFRFIAFWKRAHGKLPRELVFDSRLTTQPNLVRLDDMGVDFITLRRRSPHLLEQVASLPASAWRTVELERAHTEVSNRPRVYEQAVTISGSGFSDSCSSTTLGHDKPTVLLTNQRRRPLDKLITRYAQRMAHRKRALRRRPLLPHERLVLGRRTQGSTSIWPSW
jgi:hypothetical protein